MTETPMERYSAELVEILELRDVPKETIAQIVREVESHAAEFRENPVSAFGTPNEYADNFAPRLRMIRWWALTVSSVVLASGGGYVFISGVFGLQSSGIVLWGLPPWARIVVGAAGMMAFVVLLLVAGSRSKRRSRSWRI